MEERVVGNSDSVFMYRDGKLRVRFSHGSEAKKPHSFGDWTAFPTTES